MKRIHPAAAAMALQAAVLCALGACAALSGLVLTGWALAWIHGAAIWLVQPLLGAWLSMRCAVRNVPAILAWIPAPACFAAVYWAIVGMAPHLGAAALCALFCIVGASAGEVWLKRSKTKGK